MKNSIKKSMATAVALAVMAAACGKEESKSPAVSVTPVKAKPSVTNGGPKAGGNKSGGGGKPDAEESLFSANEVNGTAEALAGGALVYAGIKLNMGIQALGNSLGESYLEMLKPYRDEMRKAVDDSIRENQIEQISFPQIDG